MKSVNNHIKMINVIGTPNSHKPKPLAIFRSSLCPQQINVAWSYLAPRGIYAHARGAFGEKRTPDSLASRAAPPVPVLRLWR